MSKVDRLEREYDKARDALATADTVLLELAARNMQGSAQWYDAYDAMKAQCAACKAARKAWEAARSHARHASAMAFVSCWK